jgi:ParB family chromosome partitioning protein
MERIQKIPLQAIDLSDETFSVNFMPDLQRLRASIKEMGLIQPIILRERHDGYQIVSGFRRISILKEMGDPDILSRVIEENEMDDLQAFSISLHENLTTRGFNTVEKAIALDKLVHSFQMDEKGAINKYLPLFDLETDEKILNTFLSLAQMEEKIKRYVLKEGVSRTNIRRFWTLSSEDRKSLLALISPLKLGENRLREILTLLEEISKRDQVTIKEIAAKPEIQSVLSHRELTPSQRTERMRKVLMSLRYPKMFEMEGSFEKKKGNLNLPSGVTLFHSPFFEGQELKIEFQFETVEDYRSIVSSLSSLVGKRELKELIES